MGHLQLSNFNARSLNANFDKIETYISQLDFRFDIIAVSETWFSEHTQIQVFNIEGYNVHYVSRNDGRGGGVAMYISKALKYKKIENKSLCVDECFECLTMEMIMDGSKNVIIACIYRKPGTQIEDFSS